MKKNNNEEDMKLTVKTIKKMATKSYKPSLWDKFKEGVGTFFTACFLLLSFILVIFLFITLIENPVSLAIFCGTILLMFMWGNI